MFDVADMLKGALLESFFIYLADITGSCIGGWARLDIDH